MGKTNHKPEPPKRSPTLKIVVIAIIGVAIAALVVTVILTRRPVDIPPRLPRTTSVSFPAARYSKGSTDASVTLVEFGDYQCPTCGHYHPFIDKLLEQHPEDLRVVYYHIPLEHVHPNAIQAASAAEAAGEAGHYWEMHDLLFVNQAEWAGEADPEPMFIGYADRIGIDVDQFANAMKSDRIRAIVDGDIQAAVKLGVRSTPTFYINGEVIEPPRTYQAFYDVIVAAIQG